MAQKDWKKINAGWKNKKDNERIYINKEGTGYMLVRINFYNNSSNPQIERFKTKSQALKYARSYMRKH